MSLVQARKKIAKRGRDIGVDIDACVADLRHATDWDQLVKEVKDPGLEMPAYFTQPFHAYPLGNLCWDAALEVSHAHMLATCTIAPYFATAAFM